MKKKVIITVLFIISIVALVLIGCIIEFSKPVGPGIPMPRILIILIPAVVLAVFVALNIRMLKKKYHRERYEE